MLLLLVLFVLLVHLVLHALRKLGEGRPKAALPCGGLRYVFAMSSALLVCGNLRETKTLIGDRASGQLK